MATMTMVTFSTALTILIMNLPLSHGSVPLIRTTPTGY